MAITDAMVEAAIKAYFNNWGGKHEGMRAALEAAYPKFTASVDPKATLLTTDREREDNRSLAALVHALRSVDIAGKPFYRRICLDAADRIEALERENEALRTKLTNAYKLMSLPLSEESHDHN